MFIYSGINVIWDPWILICHPLVSFVQSALRRAQMTLSGGNQNPQASNHNNVLKMNIMSVLVWQNGTNVFSPSL